MLKPFVTSMTRAMVLAVILSPALLLTGASASAGSVVRVEYGLQDLDEKEREQLLSLVDQLAKVEAIMATCDQVQRYDTRLQEKVGPCIERDSIDAMQRLFEQRFEIYIHSIDRTACEKPEFQAKLPEFKEAMNSALTWIGLMCTFCLFC